MAEPLSKLAEKCKSCPKSEKCDHKRMELCALADLPPQNLASTTVYTADGKELATYKGKIDLRTNDGEYVKFDFDGKRYIYYNCFVESIADID